MAAVIMEREYAGTIREIIFHNKENGYTVAVFESQRLAEDAAKPDAEAVADAAGVADTAGGTPDYFTVVGNLPGASPGKTYLIRGTFTEHPTPADY